MNGWLVTDPEMSLYDGMIGFATGNVDKAGFAALLKSLATPITDDDDGEP